MPIRDGLPTPNSEQILIEVSHEFLSPEIEAKAPEEIHAAFQDEIRKLYETIKPLTNKMDAPGILDDLAQRFKPAENTSKVPTIARMFPKPYLQNLNIDGAMECTLASAMYKLTLEEQGFDNVRTVLTQGHQLSMQELEDGSITISDPSTRWTDENKQQHGFSETFSPEEIKDKTPVYDSKGNLRGYSFTIATTRSINHTGLFEDVSEDGIVKRKFFASEPSTLIELSIALENLDDLKNKSDYSSLQDFDSKQIIESLGIFNPKTTYQN